MASTEWGQADHSGMQLSTLCDLIAAHRSLQRAQIMAAESYAIRGSSPGHKFLVLELQSLDGYRSYLRLERRPKKGQARRTPLLLNVGEREINDLVRLLEHLTIDILTSSRPGSTFTTQGRPYQ